MGELASLIVVLTYVAAGIGVALAAEREWGPTAPYPDLWALRYVAVAGAGPLFVVGIALFRLATKAMRESAPATDDESPHRREAEWAGEG